MAELQDLIRAEHALRTEQVQHLKAQAKQYAESSGRAKAEAQAKRIKKCDGSSQKRLREWLREIQLSVPYAERTVYVASLTAEGPLRLELEKFLSTQNDRAATTWDEVEVHLRKMFLTAHEQERLRDALEKLKRNTYETTMAYGRRFSEAADLAYPHNSRNQDQQRIMLRLYMRGLDDEKLVLRLVQEKDPENYLEAIEAVNRYEADSYTLYRALNGEAPPDRDTREEEPMDISALQQSNTKSSAPSGGARKKTVEEHLGDLERKIGGLAKEFTKLKASERSFPSQERSRSYKPPFRGKRGGQQTRRSTLKFTPEGLPICANCDRPGHIRVECPRNGPT